MPVKINDKKKCTACTACFSICPKNCITMEKDSQGFQYPKVESKDCIKCERCISVCPVLNPVEKKNETNPNVYAAVSKDEDNRFKSTSGGVFSEIAQIVLKKSGVVYGASYDENNLVEHISIEKYSGLGKIRQSKYLQSDLKEVFKDILVQLKKERYVCFCGAPCQVAGLYKFLGKKYENLLTIDFVCRGMNSPKAFKSWINELEEKHNASVKNVWFKYKNNGWKRSPKTTKVAFENGENIVLSGEENIFMQGYLHYNLYTRPACSSCKFKEFPRVADITLGDFWGVKSEIDDDRGTSLVVLNNKKANEIWSVLPNIKYEEKSFDEAVAGNACFHKSIRYNKYGRIFLEKLDEYSFSEALSKYGKEDPFDIFLDKIDGIKKRIKKGK